MIVRYSFVVQIAAAVLIANDIFSGWIVTLVLE